MDNISEMFPNLKEKRIRVDRGVRSKKVLINFPEKDEIFNKVFGDKPLLFHHEKSENSDFYQIIISINNLYGFYAFFENNKFPSWKDICCSLPQVEDLLSELPLKFKTYRTLHDLIDYQGKYFPLIKLIEEKMPEMLAKEKQSLNLPQTNPFTQFHNHMIGYTAPLGAGYVNVNPITQNYVAYQANLGNFLVTFNR